MNEFHFEIKSILIPDSASELAWETPEENDNLLTTMVEEEEDEDESDSENSVSNIERIAPYSSISEVYLHNLSEMESD